MSSWVIDRYLEIQKVTDLVSFKTLPSTLNAGLQTEHRLLNSRITTTVTLGSEDRFLKVQLHIDWMEQAAKAEEQPVLSYFLPLDNSTGRLLCDVPGGAQWRTQQEQDVPCLRYGAAELADGRVLVLGSDCKYGFRLSRGDLFATLINTAYNPDPYPERGIHDITLFLLAANGSPAELARQTDAILNPLQYVTNTAHGGTLPTTAGFLKTEGETAVFSSVSQKNGKLTLRVYESEGKLCPVSITPRGSISGAQLTDLFGKALDLPVEADGNTVRFTLRPYTTVQVQIDQ
jgi:alpha-mannosidase